MERLKSRLPGVERGTTIQVIAQPEQNRPARNTAQSTPLETLFQIIASAPRDVVDRTVGEIRKGASLENVLASARRSWDPEVQAGKAGRGQHLQVARRSIPQVAGSIPRGNIPRPLKNTSHLTAQDNQPNVHRLYPLTAAPNPGNLILEPVHRVS